MNLLIEYEANIKCKLRLIDDGTIKSFGEVEDDVKNKLTPMMINVLKENFFYGAESDVQIEQKKAEVSIET